MEYIKGGAHISDTAIGENTAPGGSVRNNTRFIENISVSGYPGAVAVLNYFMVHSLDVKE